MVIRTEKSSIAFSECVSPPARQIRSPACINCVVPAAVSSTRPSKHWTVSHFAAPTNRNASLEAFFRLLVFNCVIRNGDAHLKNFGILYGDPSTAGRDACLSPVYDLVCTTVFIPKDVLAPSIRGSKGWPNGKMLERFGKEVCDVKDPAATIDEVIEGALGYRADDPKSEMWKRVRAEIEAGVQAIQTQRASRQRLGRPRSKTGVTAP